jgi:hypothetical protein
VSHLQLALRNVHKYSVPAADDVITAVRELCDQQCVELLPHHRHGSGSCSAGESMGPEGVLTALLLAYASHPKTSPGRVVDKVPWKVSVVTVMNDIFRLGQTALLSIAMPCAVKDSDGISACSGSSSSSSEVVTPLDHDHLANVEADAATDADNDVAARFTEAFVKLSVTELLSLYQVMGGKTAPSGVCYSSRILFCSVLFCSDVSRLLFRWRR